MRLEEKIKHAWDELLFWIRREMSLTLIFWLIIFLAAIIRWLYLK